MKGCWGLEIAVIVRVGVDRTNARQRSRERSIVVYVFEREVEMVSMVMSRSWSELGSASESGPLLDKTSLHDVHHSFYHMQCIQRLRTSEACSTPEHSA